MACARQSKERRKPPYFRDMKRAVKAKDQGPMRLVVTSSKYPNLDENLQVMLEKARPLLARQGKDLVNQQMMEAVGAGAPKKCKGAQEGLAGAKWRCAEEPCTVPTRPKDGDCSRMVPPTKSLPGLGQGGRWSPRTTGITGAGLFHI
ncbi:hypothetical protein NDU88_001251 [Pleurodeles waltl]|uniref:Uncharacterized protein n=1 Tax=Pleurodeles waltl TaxID=8319 RepID=A0AAV7U6I8_PLEWA|nr:hypothetical protein NDU88_001251 [Pleurodeles waltl]